MLTHHDARPYAEAASEAANQMRAKLDKMITVGRTKGKSLIDYIDRQMLTDRIVKGSVLRFEEDDDDLMIRYPSKDTEIVHRHALGQIANLSHVPMQFINHLQDQPYGMDLLTHNLNTIFEYDTEKHLTRSEGGVLKGLLSSKYKRIDPKPMFQMLVQACDNVGAVPYDAKALDVKFNIRLILPRMFEPLKDEVIGFGIDYTSSQFGAGAETVSVFILRMWCTNLATIESPLRRVHIGTRLDEDMEWSKELMDSESKTLALHVRDSVHSLLGPGHVEKVCEGIRAADQERISGKEAFAFLKKNLPKGEAEVVMEQFATESDVEILPKNSSNWRLSNAISWFANTVENEERALDLNSLAGTLIEVD